MSYAAFDVVVVPFPYSDRLAEKRRPAVVVSSEALSHEHRLLWLVMVTSVRGGGRPGDVILRDLGPTGLSAPSLVRVAKLSAIDPRRILRTAGVLAPADQQAVAIAFDRYLALRSA